MLIRCVLCTAALFAAACQVEESVEVDGLKELDEFLPTKRLVSLGGQPEIVELGPYLRYIVAREGDAGLPPPAEQDEIELTFDVRVFATDVIVDSTYSEDWGEYGRLDQLQPVLRGVVSTMRPGEERIVFFTSPEQTDDSWSSPIYLGEPGQGLVARIHVKEIFRN